MSELITATLDGVSLGAFEKRTGGKVSAPTTKRRPSGGAVEKIYGSNARTADAIVVERVYERDRDHELVRLCQRRVGRGALTVTEQLLDDDGAPWGTPSTWAGVLNEVEPSESDSNSDNQRTFTLTADVGVPG